MHAWFPRVALAGALAVGLAGCCTQAPRGYPPPPGGPPRAGVTHGPPPGWHAPPPMPDPAFHEALLACSDELGLPPPPVQGDRGAVALDTDQRSLLAACLEDSGVDAPPPPPPAHGE